MTKPATTAGQAMLDDINSGRLGDPLDYITAIEREAAQQTLDGMATMLGAMLPEPAMSADYLNAAISQVRTAIEHEAVGAALTVEALSGAMRSCKGVNWPKGWDYGHNFDWVARQVRAALLTSSEPAPTPKEEHAPGCICSVCTPNDGGPR